MQIQTTYTQHSCHHCGQASPRRPEEKRPQLSCRYLGSSGVVPFGEFVVVFPTYSYICVYICIRISACIHIYIYTYTYAYMCIYIVKHSAKINRLNKTDMGAPGTTTYVDAHIEHFRALGVWLWWRTQSPRGTSLEASAEGLRVGG